MKIGVMLRDVGQKGGTGVYTRNLLGKLLEMDRDNQYHLMLIDPEDRGAYSGGENVHQVVLPSRSKLWWDQVLVPRYARQQQLDVVFNPKLSIPLRCSSPTVLVMHGAEQFVVPEAFKLADRLYFTLFNPLYCRAAAAVIAMAEFSRLEIARYMKADLDRIHVIYEAYNDRCRVLGDAEKQRVRVAHELPEKFILFVGGINPIKNFGRVLRAFHQISNQTDQHLVVVGFNRWKFESDLALVDELGLAKRVRFTGYIPDEDIPGVYNLASMLAFPSLYEGFGMPVLEAMACGCPVIGSQRGASPEVSGGHALLVDPYSVAEIAQAMLRLLEEGGERQRLIEAGLEHVKRFSWEQTATKTLKLFEQLVATEQRSPLQS